MKKFLGLGTILLCISSFALAGNESDAKISELEGNVLVNTGQEYQKASPGMSLKDGDRVMVMEDGLAKITYSNGCVDLWKDGIVGTVDTKSCGKGAAGWFVCAGVAGGEDKDVLLTKVVGTVLVKEDAEFVPAKEGQKLQYGDQLKLEQGAEATVDYEGSCINVWQGAKVVNISEHACPIAALTKIKKDILVRHEKGGSFVPATEGLRVWHEDEVKLPDGSSLEIVYDNGCEETWEGTKLVSVDAEACPPAVVPVGLNCLIPPVAAAIVGIITLIDDDDDDDEPVSP